MCKVCNDDRCKGFYLYHPKEVVNRYKHIKQELQKNENKMFILIKSPSGGDYPSRFSELHVIENVSEKEKGKLIDRRYLNQESVSDVSYVVNIPDKELGTDLSYLYNIAQLGHILNSRAKS